MELGNHMQNQDNNRKSEKRSGTDRRARAIGLDFPFIDSHGNLVTEERRKSNRRHPESHSTNSPGATPQKNYA